MVREKISLIGHIYIVMHDEERTLRYTNEHLKNLTPTLRENIRMARITVEDCLDNVANRFELVMLAAKRSRQIAIGGRDPLVDDDSDKPTVIALREIAEGLITPEIIARESEIEAEEELAASFESPLL